MQNKQNVFSFYLDESLWFKEGQGVRELIGISLEPEITIEELGDEVRLQGTVDLAGEYVAIEDSDMFDDEGSIQSVRVMDQVERGDEGICYFSHSFPVEITVPIERVSSLENVLVDIESFDYELPATHQLRLHAQLNINGVENKESKATNDSGFDESTTVGPVNFNDHEEEVRPIYPEREAPVVQLNNDRQQEDKQEDDGRWVYKKKSQSFSDFFGHQQTAEETMDVSSESTSVWEESTAEEHSVSSPESSVENEAPGGMDGIKQIFKHLFPNREDTYTQMKMYIAQEDETLASIAEKYEVSVKQLERANDDAEDVSPGQIVYIPN